MGRERKVINKSNAALWKTSHCIEN